MKIGFVVGSVSREAGGLFQSVRGLTKAVTCASASARVFGIGDKQSTVDLPDWQPLAIQTFRPQLRAWGYSRQLLPAMLDTDLDILSTHGLWKYCSIASLRWHCRMARPYIVHPHGTNASAQIHASEPTVIGGRSSWLKKLAIRAPFRPSLRFLYHYVWKQGFRDGYRGWVLCRLLAWYERMILLKEFELKRRPVSDRL